MRVLSAHNTPRHYGTLWWPIIRAPSTQTHEHTHIQHPREHPNNRNRQKYRRRGRKIQLSFVNIGNRIIIYSCFCREFSVWITFNATNGQKNGESAQRDALVATFPWQPKPNVSRSCSNSTDKCTLNALGSSMPDANVVRDAISTKMISNQLNIVTLMGDATKKFQLAFPRIDSWPSISMPHLRVGNEIERKNFHQIFIHPTSPQFVSTNSWRGNFWRRKKRRHATDWASVWACECVKKFTNLFDELFPLSIAINRLAVPIWHTDYLISDQFVLCWQKIAQFVSCVRCGESIKQPSNQ